MRSRARVDADGGRATLSARSLSASGCWRAGNRCAIRVSVASHGATAGACTTARVHCVASKGPRVVLRVPLATRARQDRDGNASRRRRRFRFGGIARRSAVAALQLLLLLLSGDVKGSSPRTLTLIVAARTRSSTSPPRASRPRRCRRRWKGGRRRQPRRLPAQARTPKASLRQQGREELLLPLPRP